MADAAVAMARRLDDPDALLTALCDRAFVVGSAEDLRRRKDLAEEVLELARVSGRPDRAVAGHEWRFDDCLIRGDLTAATRALDEFEALASVAPSPFWRYTSSLRRAMLLLVQGDRDGAVETIAASAQASRGLVDRFELIGFELAIRAPAMILFGLPDPRVAELQAQMVEMFDHAPSPFMQIRLAMGDLLVGDRAAARRRATRWLADPTSAFEAPDPVGTLALMALLACELQITEPAPAIAEALNEFTGLVAGGDPTTGRSAARPTGHRHRQIPPTRSITLNALWSLLVRCRHRCSRRTACAPSPKPNSPPATPPQPQPQAAAAAGPPSAMAWCSRRRGHDTPPNQRQHRDDIGDAPTAINAHRPARTRRRHVEDPGRSPSPPRWHTSPDSNSSHDSSRFPASTSAPPTSTAHISAHRRPRTRTRRPRQTRVPATDQRAPSRHRRSRTMGRPRTRRDRPARTRCTDLRTPSSHRTQRSRSPTGQRIRTRPNQRRPQHPPSNRRDRPSRPATGSPPHRLDPHRSPLHIRTRTSSPHPLGDRPRTMQLPQAR